MEKHTRTEMTKDEAISVLNLTAGRPDSYYKRIAETRMNAFTLRAPLKHKVAARVLISL